MGIGTQPHTTTDDGVDVSPLAYVHEPPDLPPDPFVINNTDSFQELINFVYPDILHADPTEFKARAILSSTNATIDLITRNLNFKQGLVNGQKAIVRGYSTRIVHVELLDGQSSPVLIPRIRFKTKVGRNGISFSRLQLPLRVCYALTINKSQGQTLTKIGLDLRTDVFTHGQLYVALSRAQKRSSIMCLTLPARLRGALNRTAFVANITFPAFVNAAADSESESPPMPQRYIDFIGYTTTTDNADNHDKCDTVAQEKQLNASQGRHPNHCADGGWIEAKTAT